MERRIEKTISIIVCILLLVAVLASCGIILKKVTDKPSNELTNSENSGTLPAPDDENAGGFLVGDRKENGIELAMVAIPQEDFEDYGISAIAESAYSLTATVTPADSGDKKVTYTAAWKNPSSSWANGKNITDYVSITQATEGALKATLNCLKAFGEPVKVTCSLASNAKVSAECVCQYVKRITALDISLTPNASAFNATYTVKASPVYTDGTVTGSFAETGYKVSLVNDFMIAVRQNYVKGTSDADWVWRASAEMSSSITARNFQFWSSSPAETFAIQGTTGYMPTGVVLPKFFPQEAIDSAFKTACTSYSGAEAQFILSYTYTYNGMSYAPSDTFVADLKFNPATLVIQVM